MVTGGGQGLPALLEVDRGQGQSAGQGHALLTTGETADSQEVLLDLQDATTDHIDRTEETDQSPEVQDRSHGRLIGIVVDWTSKNF